MLRCAVLPAWVPADLPSCLLKAPICGWIFAWPAVQRLSSALPAYSRSSDVPQFSIGSTRCNRPGLFSYLWLLCPSFIDSTYIGSGGSATSNKRPITISHPRLSQPSTDNHPSSSSSLVFPPRCSSHPIHNMPPQKRPNQTQGTNGPGLH